MKCHKNIWKPSHSLIFHFDIFNAFILTLTPFSISENMKQRSSIVSFFFQELYFLC